MATPQDWESNRSSEISEPRLLATTNYGAQVAYNYGSVSNYFCSSSAITHQCHFPEISSKNGWLDDQLYKKIKTARELYNSSRWEPAKALFEEVLFGPYASLVATERILLQYNLAHTHFALGEFSDAASQFKDVLDVYGERDEPIEESVNDTRFWLARSFYHLEQYADASEELQIFILEHETQHGSGVKQATAAQLWLGLTFERLGHYSLAKQQLSSAYETRVKVLGPEHLDTLAGRHHLANFLYKQKRYLEAKEHFHALILVEDNLSGPEKGQAVRTRCMLAFCLAKVERYDEAEPHLERVFARIDSLPYLMEVEVRDFGLVCYWLGRIALGKETQRSSVKRAEHLLQRALKMISDYLDICKEQEERKMTLGDDPGKKRGNSEGYDDDFQDELIGCRCYHAHAMRRERQFVAAEQVYREILDAASATKHDYLIASRNGLARSLIGQRKLPQALSVLEEVVSPTSSLEGCRHTGEDLGACLDALGEIYLRQKNYSEARECFQRVVNAAPEKPNLHHSVSRLNLGITLFSLRNFESARSNFHEIHKVSKQDLSHIEIRLEVECWLSWSLCEVGRYEEGEVYLRSIFTITSAKNEESAASFEEYCLGFSHYYQGRAALHRCNIAEATKHLRLGLGKIGRYDGLNGSRYLECRYYLAYSLFVQRNYDEAVHMFEELQQTEGSVEPLKDIRLVLAPYWLGQVSFAQGQRNEAETFFAKSLESLHGDTLPLHPDISAGYVRFWHANSLFSLQRNDECCCIIRDILVDHNPKDADDTSTELCRWSRVLLGNSLHAVEKFEEACEHLKSSLADLESRHGLDSNNYSKTRALLVDSLSELRLHNEAAPHLLRLRTMENTSNIAARNEGKAITCYWLGRRAFRENRFGQEQVPDYFMSAQRCLVGLKSVRYDHMRMDCQHFLARLQLRDKNYAYADEMFQDLARQQYESENVDHAVDNQLWHGRSLYAQSMYAAAIPVFQKITDLNKAGRVERYAIAMSHHLTGHCLYSQKNYKQAKSHYAMALQFPSLKSEAFASRLWLARCNFNIRSYEEAKTHYRSCLEQSTSKPEDVVQARYWLGRTYFALRDWEQAGTYLKEAVLSSGNQQLSHSDALEAQLYVGRARINAGKYMDALDPLLGLPTKCRGQRSPTYLSSMYYAALAWYERGQFAASRRRLLSLIKEYQEMKPTPNPDILTAEFLVARCLVGLAAYTKAKAELERIIKIPLHKMRAVLDDQTIMLAHYDLARIAYLRKGWDQVVEHTQAALLQHETVHTSLSTLPERQCHRYLAIALQELGRKEEANQLYKKLLDRQNDEIFSPTQRVPLLDMQISLTRTLYRLDKLNLDEDVYREASELPRNLSDPSHPYNVRHDILLADVAFRLEDFSTAEATWTKILALFETSKKFQDMTPIPIGYLQTGLAMTLSKLERIDDALELAAKALETDCSHAHKCKSFKGFADAFPELLLSLSDRSDVADNNKLPSTCSDPAHHPKKQIATTIKASPQPPETMIVRSVQK